MYVLETCQNLNARVKIIWSDGYIHAESPSMDPEEFLCWEHATGAKPDLSVLILCGCIKSWACGDVMAGLCPTPVK